jgi:hypothetical protein
MRDQHDVDRRQVFKGHARFTHALWARERHWRGAFRPDGIGQDIDVCDLNQHACMPHIGHLAWDVVEMTKVLGERRAETAKWYGLNWRGARFRRTPDIAIERGTVETARPVVQRESDFLAKKKEAKAGKKKLAGPLNR